MEIGLEDHTILHREALIHWKIKSEAFCTACAKGLFLAASAVRMEAKMSPVPGLEAPAEGDETMLQCPSSHRKLEKPLGV